MEEKVFGNSRERELHPPRKNPAVVYIKLPIHIYIYIYM